MSISILGSGNIGSTLGRKWAQAGHRITFAARNPDDPKYEALLAGMPGQAAVAPLQNALDTAEVVLLAMPGTTVGDTLEGLGAALDGKIIVDATNKLGQDTMNSFAAIAAIAPSSSLFRAFNTLGWENFEQPTLNETQIDLFFCGDAGAAQEIVANLISDVGLNPVYVGDRNQVAVVDNLTRLWFALAFEQGYGRRTALKLLTA